MIKAVREDGFFYVKNFNISQEHVNRQFSLGKQFYELPLEEKVKYVPDLGKFFHTLHMMNVLMRVYSVDNGGFNGYTPAGRRM